MISPEKALSSGGSLNREQFIGVLRAALMTEDSRFARQAAVAWLGSFPGDLQVNLLYAQALSKAGKPEKALPVLDHLSQCDPEYLEAVEALVQARAILQFQTPSKQQTIISASPVNQDTAQFRDQIGWLLALGGNPEVVRGIGLGFSVLREKSLVGWSRALSKARQAFEKGKLELAEREIHEALSAEASTPLVDVLHLRILNARSKENGSGTQMLRSLAAFYRQRWPDCLQFTLLLADALMDSGEPEKAVALLHEAAVGDIGGQVAQRLWGADHSYHSLWPEQCTIELDLPIPTAVLAILGWNRLPERIGQAEIEQPVLPVEGKTKPPVTEVAAAVASKSQLVKSSPRDTHSTETLRSVQNELERLSVRLNKPGLGSADGRFPVYVVMTTRRGLEKRYGEDTATILETEMLRLVEAISQRRDWGALLFYADEGVYHINGSQNSLSRPGVRANDPWGLKLALTDLDAALQKRGQRIGAVLIVGSPEIVPFHKLPNPVDDADIDVPSDNPYGTSDENYFIPEWPVGRLPDGIPSEGANAQSLLYALSGLTARHKSIANGASANQWYRRWLLSMLDWFSRRGKNGSYRQFSFGITAAVWRQASLTVFRPIGDPGAMKVSPPTNGSQPSSNGRASSPLPTTRLGYFNLHGVPDAAEWYGQRETIGEGGATPVGFGEDYPVALRPSDVMNSGRAPQVVFSEACYGAHILNKTADEALSLKFIQAGTYAVAGSTCTSYGSISPPLIAADFLGHSFWNYVKDGLPAGEALRRAKISLAREMHTRQGYLDGEDQKTLISFILYGDPLAVPVGMEARTKAVTRSSNPTYPLKTVCDRAHDGDACEAVPEDIQAYVKSVVSQYLPGMQDAHLKMSLEHMNCEASHPIRQTGKSGSQKGNEGPVTRQGFQLARKVITLSKEVPNSTHVHHHYARLTLDAQGKLVKLVVSR